jgi:ATP-dependent DNA helicase RecG
MTPIWQKDITYLKKVGPQRSKILASEAGIRVYADLLHYYPRKYVDRSQVTKIREIVEERYYTLVGKITEVEAVKTQRGRGRLLATFTDGTGRLELNWFRGVKWIEKYLKKDEEVALFGKVSRFNNRLQMSHPEVDYLRNEDRAQSSLQIVPFYASSDKLGRIGLDSKGFRNIVFQLLNEAGEQIPENLSPAILQQHQLISRQQALQNIHFPLDFATLQAARRRLKFEELFFFQLMLAYKRGTNRSTHAAPPFLKVGQAFNTFYHEHLPFELTGAQKRVLKEIRRDLRQPVQMNRLIQGDVGSGKTMVAFMSMLIAKDNGFQSCLMAPTEILAEQHFKKLSRYAEPLGLKVAILVGGQRKKEREQMLELAASGEADITVGTHALIEDKVKFQRLGMVVVDEQHKFGVKQRARLWQKASPFPHNMIMTATPIPRTLAMTLYGDVDVSVIDELPPGRKPIKTLWRGESKRLQMFQFIRRELERGKQAYVVYPLVEESEKLDYLAAVQGKEVMEKYFKKYRVGMVHGRMKPEDKELEMQMFVQGKAHILVSTTVIEVGVDVPNATIMVIENAEKFGLSQLHQLRGRVGRNAEQSYCILMSGPKVSSNGKARLQAMVDTTDGFQISEVDLKLRGPGDFLGTRQSGLPEFQLANIAEDQEILKAAREAAFALYQQDPELHLPQHQVLRAYYDVYRRLYADLSTVA